jgi:hypothetical protein
MEKRYTDTDLREALRRRYADTPKLPADFMASMEQRMQTPPAAKKPRLWRWVAVAASLLLVVGIGVTLLPEQEQQVPQLAQQTAPKTVQPAAAEAVVQPSHQQELSVVKQQPTPPQPVVSRKKTITRQVETQSEADLSEVDENLHYATQLLTKDTVPYQDPARVDEFIEKMAAYHNVKEGQLKCATANDSNVVSRVYVFPDKKEVDVFGRLLQVACCYSDETPGYHLNFSHQQFFFELKDQRRQLQYRWIAERINGRILLYGTNAPIGAQTTAACYQEYRNELMHTNSINFKTREI